MCRLKCSCLIYNIIKYDRWRWRSSREVHSACTQFEIDSISNFWQYDGCIIKSSTSKLKSFYRLVCTRGRAESFAHGFFGGVSSNLGPKQNQLEGSNWSDELTGSPNFLQQRTNSSSECRNFWHDIRNKKALQVHNNILNIIIDNIKQ